MSMHISELMSLESPPFFNMHPWCIESLLLITVVGIKGLAQPLTGSTHVLLPVCLPLCWIKAFCETIQPHRGWWSGLLNGLHCGSLGNHLDSIQTSSVIAAPLPDRKNPWLKDLPTIYHCFKLASWNGSMWLLWCDRLFIFSGSVANFLHGTVQDFEKGSISLMEAISGSVEWRDCMQSDTMHAIMI